MARGDCRLSTSRPALRQLRTMRCEGMKEERCYREQYSGDPSQAEKGQGIAENQPSFRAPLILCFQGHKPLRRSVCPESTYPVYGNDADRNTSAGRGCFQVRGATGMRDECGETLWVH